MEPATKPADQDQHHPRTAIASSGPDQPVERPWRPRRHVRFQNETNSPTSQTHQDGITPGDEATLPPLRGDVMDQHHETNPHDLANLKAKEKVTTVKEPVSKTNTRSTRKLKSVVEHRETNPHFLISSQQMDELPHYQRPPGWLLRRQRIEQHGLDSAIPRLKQEQEVVHGVPFEPKGPEPTTLVPEEVVHGILSEKKGSEPTPFVRQQGQRLEPPGPQRLPSQSQAGPIAKLYDHCLQIFSLILKSDSLRVVLALLCSVLLIIVLLLGLAFLIIYLIFRPLSPQFNISTATLYSVHLGKGNLLIVNLSLTANFTNMNKDSVGFSSTVFELYLLCFGRTFLATQNIERFVLHKGQTSSKELRMVATGVRLFDVEIERLKSMMVENKVALEVMVKFLAQSRLLRYSNWRHRQCIITLKKPPHGTLVSRNCTTKQ